MEEEEHEVYGGEIPVEEGDIDMSATDDDAIKVPSVLYFTTVEIHYQYSCVMKASSVWCVNLLCSVDVAGAGRDEEEIEGDGGGSSCSSRNASQGRKGNGRCSRFTSISNYL